MNLAKIVGSAALAATSLFPQYAFSQEKLEDKVEQGSGSTEKADEKKNWRELYDLGLDEYKKGKFAEAIKAFKSAHAANSKESWILLDLAGAYRSRGLQILNNKEISDDVEGREALKSAIDVASKYITENEALPEDKRNKHGLSVAYGHRGLTQLTLGNKADARLDLEKSCSYEVDPRVQKILDGIK